MENETYREDAAAAEAAIRTLKSFARTGNDAERASSGALQTEIRRWLTVRSSNGQSAVVERVRKAV